MPHLFNLRSPTSMFPKNEEPLIKFDMLPLKDVRTCHIEVRDLEPNFSVTPLQHLDFPALETLELEGEIDLEVLLSSLFSNPSYSSLKTLKFIDCDLSTSFLQKLKDFSSGLERTNSTPLNHVTFFQVKVSKVEYWLRSMDLRVRCPILRSASAG